MGLPILTGSESGCIYVVTTDGDLLWYRDAHRNGTPGWAPNSGNRIGSGWQDFRLVFGGADGVIYGIKNNGDLLWYRDMHRDGTPGWAPSSGNRIGSGWQDFRLVFGGGDGVIYGIKNNGDLHWYRDVPRNGTPGWAANSGNRIGSGWQDFRLVFGGADGIIYGIKSNGDLLWYRDMPRNGTTGWAENSGHRIGSGWSGYPRAIGGEGGVIYSVDPAGLLRWYVDVPRDGTVGWGQRSGDVIGSGWLDVEWSPTLAAFGHGTMLQQGKPAVGPRRLLVVLAEYQNDANNGFPPFSSRHPTAYYEQLGFGQPQPPFSTQNPVNPASLTGYFRECSINRFWLERAGLVGPVAMGVLNDPGPELRSKRILDKVAELNPRVFLDSDLDGDQFVSSSELLVLIVENIAALQPANRDNSPVQVRRQIGPLSFPVTVTLHVSFAGPLTPFYQIAHELSHSLGTLDMYNSGAGNSLLTLMGGYSFFGDDQGTVHLDAWHKLALGWCEPRRRRLTRGGNELLVEITPSRPTSPIILWHPGRGAGEYFLVERRTSASTSRAYDSGFAGNGALVWRVTPGVPTPASHLGSPNLTLGGNGVWVGGQTTPPLLWSDGSSTGVQLSFQSSPDLRVPWG
jgi:M6 family metalloprotease-like protein